MNLRFWKRGPPIASNIVITGPVQLSSGGWSIASTMNTTHTIYLRGKSALDERFVGCILSGEAIHQVLDNIGEEPASYAIDRIHLHDFHESAADECGLFWVDWRINNPKV